MGNKGEQEVWLLYKDCEAKGGERGAVLKQDIK